MVTKAKGLQKWIPFDIMAAFILPRLPVKSLARFRCVCKQWCSLIYDTQFIMKQLKNAFKTTESCTLFDRDLHPEGHMPVYNLIQISSNGEVDDDFSFHINFEDAACYTSSNPVNGLICTFRLSNHKLGDGFPYLVNPTTRQLLQLPKVKNVGWSSVSGRNVALGFDDSTGVYKVIRPHIKQWSNSTYFDVLTVGTQEWRRIGEIPWKVLSLLVLFKYGALHWLVFRYDQNPKVPAILTFDIKEEKFQFIPIPEGVPKFNYLNTLSIKELEGHLCLVQYPIIPTESRPALDPPTLIIWKLKDYMTHTWTQEYAIDMSHWPCGNDVYHYSAGLITIIGEKLLFKKCGTLYSYDLHRGTLHTLPCKSRQLKCLEVFRESLVSPSSLV